MDFTKKIQQIIALAKDVDDKELFDKVVSSLEKVRDYDEDNGGDENPEDQEGFRVFDPDQEKDYEEYEPGEDEDAHQQESEYDPTSGLEPRGEDAPEPGEAGSATDWKWRGSGRGNRGSNQSVSPNELLSGDVARYGKSKKAKAPKDFEPSVVRRPGGNEEVEEPSDGPRFPQPTKEEIAGLREYTRPWEQRARDTARLTAEAHKNPELHHQGHLIESRNKTLGDKNDQYNKLTASPEYKNADPITQMELDAKFHENYNKANPDHLKNAVKGHNEAHMRGAKAHDVHAAAKDEQIRHVLQGGAQNPDAMSMEAAMQHAGGTKSADEGTTGSVMQDKAAAFAGGNQDFLKQYAKDYNKKHVKPKSVEDMGEYNDAGRQDIARVLGDNPALKDPKKRAQMDQFFGKYYPLIGMNAARVLSKFGLDAKKTDLDLGSMHEAGMHGLMQAINDYDHDHPSKASFATHASNKIRGLQQTALKAQDQIPEEIRSAAKKHQSNASQVQKPQAPVNNNPPPEIETSEPAPAAAPEAAAPAFKPKVTRRAGGVMPPIRHAAINERLKRIDTHRSALGVGGEPEEGEEE